MRHARRAGPARRRSSASRVASVQTARRSPHARSHARSRWPISSRCAIVRPFPPRRRASRPLSRPRGRRFIRFAPLFPSHHSPLVHRRRPRTAKETRRRRWNPSRSSPMRRRSPSRSSTPRYWRRRRSSGNRGRRRRMPTSRRCAPRRLAFFAPSRLASVAATSRGPVPTQFRCPRHHARRSRRPRRLSRAPRRPRVTMRAIARARAPSTTRARPARAPPQISHPQIAELFKARQVARPRLDSWI